MRLTVATLLLTAIAFSVASAGFEPAPNTVPSGSGRGDVAASGLSRYEILPGEPDQYQGYFPGLTVVQGEFPDSGVFGWGLSGNPYSETLSVRRRIAPTSTTRSAPAAVAGYAYTQSPRSGAVGVFGMASMSAEGGTDTGYPATFGGNFLAQNCAADDVFCTQGHSGGIYGVEVDANVAPLEDGTAPLGFAYGIHVSGASNSRPPSTVALHIDPMNGYSRHIKWSAGVLTEDGAADNAAVFGATCNSQPVRGVPVLHVNCPSQGLRLRTFDREGQLREASFVADSDANILLEPPKGGFVVAAGVLKAGPEGIQVKGGGRFEGHLAAEGADEPGMENCGATAMTAGSNDTRGTVSFPIGQRTCTLRFRHPSDGAPFCTATSSSELFPAAVSSPKATEVTLRVKSADLPLSVTWHCLD